MKLITWNCQGAFRKKAGIILNHQPDILVVQECEHPDKLIFDSATKRQTDFHWYGDSAHKGIAICSYTDYKIELLPVFNAEFRYVLPFSVTGCGYTFTLFDL